MVDMRNKPISRTFEVAQPAAGAGFTITPNTGANWLVRALTFTLVTDANAATRAVLMRVDGGGNPYRVLPAGTTQIAALTRTYSGSEGVESGVNTGTLISLVFPSDGILLPVGHTLTVAIENVQAGDQVSAINGYRLEFPLGPSTHYWPMVSLMQEESS